jgi:hypothetical protein
VLSITGTWIWSQRLSSRATHPSLDVAQQSSGVTGDCLPLPAPPRLSTPPFTPLSRPHSRTTAVGSIITTSYPLTSCLLKFNSPPYPLTTTTTTIRSIMTAYPPTRTAVIIIAVYPPACCPLRPHSPPSINYHPPPAPATPPPLLHSFTCPDHPPYHCHLPP